MRILILLVTACLFLSLEASAQDSLAPRYRSQTVRLYAQGGMYFTSIDAFDPTNNGRSYFKDKGISYPSFGLGAIIEGKSEKPRFYMGAGLSFASFDFGGERYVKIISPEQEELEVYNGSNKLFNIEFFAGYYVWLNDLIALKPQLGLAVSSIKTKFDCDVYQYQTDNLKRSTSRPANRSKLTGQAAMYLSFKKRFELGVNYFAAPAASVGMYHSLRFNSVGASIRYIHSF